MPKRINHGSADDATHLQNAPEAAVRAGGDTDTTAAIAGGLLGARWGRSAVPTKWWRKLHGWPGQRAMDLVSMAVRSTQDGADDSAGWPSVPRLTYGPGYRSANVVAHPHDPGLLLGDAGAVPLGGYDAVVSLFRMGSETLDVEHVEFWLVDRTDANANLEFVMDDATRSVQVLRAEGKTVLLHCVEAMSRTPCVAARYSLLLGKDPKDILKVLPWADPTPELWTTATING